MYVDIYADIQRHLHVYIHTYIQTYTHAYIYRYACIHMRTHGLLLIYVYQQICIHMYKNTCLHTHTLLVHMYMRHRPAFKKQATAQPHYEVHIHTAYGQ